MKRTLLLVLTINALSAVIPFTALEAAAKCESLSNLTLSNATITTAQTIEAGQFAEPARGNGQGPNFKDLPAFCRVMATVSHRTTRISRSRFGCLSQAGTESSRA